MSAAVTGRTLERRVGVPISAVPISTVALETSVPPFAIDRYAPARAVGCHISTPGFRFLTLTGTGRREGRPA